MADEPDVLVIVLAGGEGKRLSPLTNDRAKPAVPFGGCYRLIDFALSNFANARYLKIVVLTQYKSHSLDRHISQTWRFSTLLNQYVAAVPAQMRRGRSGSLVRPTRSTRTSTSSTTSGRIVCVFGADHLPDGPRQMVAHHQEVTGILVPPSRWLAASSEFGIIEVDADGRILAFHEKSADPRRCPATTPAASPRWATTCSTRRRWSTSSRRGQHVPDIGGDVIPALTQAGLAHVYDFLDERGARPGGARARVLAGCRDDRRLLPRQHGPDRPHPVFNLYNDRWPVARTAAPSRRPRCHGVRAVSRRTSTGACSARARSSPARTSSARSRARRLRRSRRARDRLDPVPVRPRRPGRPPAPLHRRQERRDPVGLPRRPRQRRDAERFTMSDEGIAVIEKDRHL